MRGPVFGPLSLSQCGYDSSSNPALDVHMLIAALPERFVSGAKTVRQAKAEAITTYNLGTAKEKKLERILDEPRLGPGAFIHASLVSGVPGGTQEEVDAYTKRWHLAMSFPTHHLLAGNEITDAAQLLASLPS